MLLPVPLQMLTPMGFGPKIVCPTSSLEQGGIMNINGYFSIYSIDFYLDTPHLFNPINGQNSREF